MKIVSLKALKRLNTSSNFAKATILSLNSFSTTPTANKEFKSGSSSLKSTIQGYFSKHQNEFAIGELADFYSENLMTIYSNYKCSAKQLKVYCLEMEKAWREEWDFAQGEIITYLNLEQLYKDREAILFNLVRKYKSNIKVEFHDHQTFLQGKTFLNEKADGLFKTRARQLYDEEITKLSNFDNYEDEKEILSNYFIENINDLRIKKYNKIKDLISYMDVDWFDLK